MRQFVVIVIVLLLLVALGGALTAAVILYVDHGDLQKEMDSNATRVAELEDQLGEAQVGLSDVQAENQSLQRENTSQAEIIATLQVVAGERAVPVTPLPEVEVTATPTPEPMTPTPDAAVIDSETAEIMDEIEWQVSELRGLDALQTVTRTLFSQDELRQYLIKEYDEDYPPEEVERDTLELAALDFVDADIDLRKLLEDLFTEQIAGFYDPEIESFAVIDAEGDGLGPLDKTVYAHEFVHALQDQHYDMDLLDPEENSDDASLAVTALIEGDAVLGMQTYMLDYMDSEELYDLLSESMEFESTVLESAPAVIQAQLDFPYVDGLVFVQHLYDRGGYAAVDAAFADPPQSTEQILHPERYLAGEAPVVVTLPPLTDTLGSGWEFVDENVIGEFGTRLYLQEQVTERMAAAAADGWGGDRYAVYYERETGELILVLRIAWDSAAEADEFASTYLTYGKGRFGFSADDDCWVGDDTICLYQSGDETLVLRAPDMDTITVIQALFPTFE